MKTQRMEDLIAWQKAIDLTVNVSQQTGKLKDQEFRSAICETALKISVSIADGFQRRNKDFQDQLRQARAASNVLRSMTYVGERLNYLDEATAADLRQQSEDVSKIISGLIKSMQPKPQNQEAAVAA